MNTATLIQSTTQARADLRALAGPPLSPAAQAVLRSFRRRLQSGGPTPKPGTITEQNGGQS